MMKKASITGFITGLLLVAGVAGVIKAQDPVTQTAPAEAQTDDQKQKAKDAAEKKATTLLEQIVGEVQVLKLPENRIRVQVAAADMLWKSNEQRARSLFSVAGEGVAEMMRSANGNVQRWAAQLRQEVVLTAAQHDAQLAYQLLATTRSQTPSTDNWNNPFRPNFDANLEQNLLTRVAAIDPKFAAQKVEEALANGQYPASLAQVISGLQAQDKEAATKLTAKVVSKLQSENMLSNTQAQTLALSLLRSGPLSAAATSDTGTTLSAATQTQTNLPSLSQTPASPANRGNAGVPVLGESSFEDLFNTVIDAALKAQPQPQTGNQRGQNQRGRGNLAPQTADQSPPTDGQIEQQNARRLLNGMQALLPLMDQYLPSRAATVRNKMTELGMGTNPRLAPNQLNSLMQQGTADSLLAAAPTAPPPMQSRIYQQAAQKALDEGNADRARQIATDHLDPGTRDAVLQKVDFQLIAKKVDAANMDQLRQTLSGLRSDDERIELLLQLAGAAQKTAADPNAAGQNNDPKLALRFLGEAQHLANRRATNYKQFDQQLRVADAFAALEPARSFDVLDPGIGQLNELLSAAALLSGFEVDIFKDGELPLEGGSSLGDMVARYGQELATLAKIDFARAETSAGKFQLPEPRLFTQLSIVRSVLGVPQAPPIDNGFGGGRGFGRRGQ